MIVARVNISRIRLQISVGVSEHRNVSLPDLVLHHVIITLGEFSAVPASGPHPVALLDLIELFIYLLGVENSYLLPFRW